MHVAVVTNWYPDRRANAEYALHLVEGLRQARPQNRVSVLAGRPGPLPGRDDDVQRAWTHGGYRIAGELIAAVRRQRPQAVLVNCSFNSWGNHVSNLLGFRAIACLARELPTVALLHYLPQTMPVEQTGYRLTPLHWAAIRMACRMAAGADTVGFTLARDAEYFRRHFKPNGTVQVEHGLLGPRGSVGWEEADGVPTVLAFGYWGPGKRLEMLLEAVEQVPDIRLIVAGASHPRFPGYVEAVRARWTSPRVRWTGYVPEEELPSLFRSARLVALPYAGDTGTSGVLHLAAQHGRAIVASELPVLQRESARLGIVANFFGDVAALRQALGVLHEAERLRAEGQQNLDALRPLEMAAVGERWWQLLEGSAPLPDWLRPRGYARGARAATRDH